MLQLTKFWLWTVSLLFLTGGCMSNKTIPAEDYYYDYEYSDATVEVEECDTNVNTCVRKCCPEGENWSFIEYGCVGNRFEALWKPTFFSDELEEQLPPSNLKVLHGFPCEFYLETEFYLMNDGSLYTPLNNRKESVKHYCIDNFYNESHLITYAGICFPDETDITCREVKSSLLVVSATFLFITLLVYLIVPHLRSNVHGKVLISYTSALFVTYISLSIIQFGAQDLTALGCKIFRKYDY